MKTQSQSKTAEKFLEQFDSPQDFVDVFCEQLYMAGLIQSDFLPKQFPDCQGFRWDANFMPAEWVSGDFYDVQRIDESHIGFYVADVVGHGVPAALLTIFLKQAITMRQTSGNDYRVIEPAEVMSSLNQRLAEQQLSGNQFVTCCYCLLNIKTLELSYSRAGHPYPLLIRDGQIEQLKGTGTLLGIFELARYSQTTVQLRPGDKVILYSDGAEPYIGKCHDNGKFEFKEEFTKLINSSIEGFTEKFQQICDGQISKAEIDDITTLGLEIV